MTLLLFSSLILSQNILPDERLHEPDLALVGRFTFDLLVVIGVELEQANHIDGFLRSVLVASLVLQVDQILEDVHVPDTVIVSVRTIVTDTFP